jgi:hypothetical protein
MKTLASNDIFNALLFGLPQGMLLAVIWVAYSAWMALTMRRFVPVWSPRRFGTFVSVLRPTGSSRDDAANRRTTEEGA